MLSLGLQPLYILFLKKKTTEISQTTSTALSQISIKKANAIFQFT